MNTTSPSPPSRPSCAATSRLPRVRGCAVLCYAALAAALLCSYSAGSRPALGSRPHCMRQAHYLHVCEFCGRALALPCHAGRAFTATPCTPPSALTPVAAALLFSAGEIALDATYEFLCAYLAELTLMDYGMLHYLPSHIGAAIVLVALYMLGKPTWSPTLQHYTGYSPPDLRRCAQVGGRAACGQQGTGTCLRLRGVSCTGLAPP